MPHHQHPPRLLLTAAVLCQFHQYSDNNVFYAPIIQHGAHYTVNLGRVLMTSTNLIKHLNPLRC